MEGPRRVEDPVGGAECPDDAGLTPAEARELAMCRSVNGFGAIMHVLSQLRLLRASPDRIQRLVCCGLVVVPWAWPVAAPRSFLARRNWICGGVKVAYFLFPAMRAPHGLREKLDAPATPGAAGAALDALRIAFGCRAMIVFLYSLSPPLPLLPQLALQLYSIAMTHGLAPGGGGGGEGVCASRLLRDSAPRVAAFHRLMAALSAPTTTAGGMLAAPPLARTPLARPCEAFITFVWLLVGLLLPALLVARIPAFGAMRGWVRQLKGLRSAPGRAACEMLCGRGAAGGEAGGRRRRLSLGRLLLYWWMVLHLAWVVAVAVS